jgi:hypothetical protein
MAASTADPPALSSSTPASDAAAWGHATMPFAALVAGRPVSTCASLRERHRA